MIKYKDRIGERYGRLIVIEFAGRNKASIKQKTVLWKCNCDCGTINHIVHARNLASGRVKSCGCLAVEQSRKAGIAKALPPGEAGVRRLYNKYMTRAKHKNIKFNIEREDFKKLTSSNCFYCGQSPKQICVSYRRYLEDEEYEYNGLDRIDSDKGYTIDNVVSACGLCNRAKYTLSQDEFLNHIKKIYDYILHH